MKIETLKKLQSKRIKDKLELAESTSADAKRIRAKVQEEFNSDVKMPEFIRLEVEAINIIKEIAEELDLDQTTVTDFVFNYSEEIKIAETLAPFNN